MLALAGSSPKSPTMESWGLQPLPSLFLHSRRRPHLPPCPRSLDYSTFYCSTLSRSAPPHVAAPLDFAELSRVVGRVSNPANRKPAFCPPTQTPPPAKPQHGLR